MNGYTGSAGLAQPVAQTLSATLGNVLADTERAHGLFSSLEERIQGPRPSGAEKSTSPNGIVDATQRLNASVQSLCMRIEQLLGIL